MIYLDNQTLSPPSKEVLDAVAASMQNKWQSSLAPYSTYIQDLDPLYTLVGANKEDHFLFTSSGAEAISNVVMSTYIDVTRKNGKHHYLTSSTGEAPAILSMTRLQEMGCHFQMVDGMSVEAFAETITPRTALISLSWADGMSGVIHPISEIAKLCKERGILFHVDASHVLGKGHFPFADSGIDFMTFNGEQIGGPKGSGGIFIRDGCELSPLIFGQALNHPALAGLIVAAKQGYEMCDHLCIETAHLRTTFEQKICASLPDTVIFFRDQKRLPSITAMGFPGVTSDALCFLLMKRKVFANMGGGNFQQISHLLKANQVPAPLRHSGLSFALSSKTSAEQIEIAVEQVIDVVKKLKRYSEAILI